MLNFLHSLRRRVPLQRPQTSRRDSPFRGLPWRVRSRFYEDAIELLPDGQGPTTILRMLGKSLLARKRRKDAQAVHRVSLAIEDGQSLSAALGSGLDDMERNILEIGEQRSHTGLAGAMREILDARARMQRVTEVAWGSLFEPIIYVLTLYGFCWVLGAQVTPAIEQLLPREKWSGWTQVLGWLGWLGTGVIPIISGVLFVGVFVSVAYALPRWTGRGRLFAERVSLIFTFYKELQGAMWLLGYAVQVKSGVPQADAIAQQVKRASPWLASRLRPVYRALVEGHALGDALRQTGHAFPSLDLIERVTVLQDGHAEALEHIARVHCDALEKRMRKLARVIGMVSLFVIFAVIGVIQLASNGLTDNLAGSVGM